MTHSWRGMAHANTNSLGVEWFGLAMGLGFVLSFGYWCTDFLVIQRAMAADSEVSARRVPLIAAIPKMFFPFLVILPGLIAVTHHLAHAASPAPGVTATPAPGSEQPLTPPRPRHGREVLTLGNVAPASRSTKPTPRHHPRQSSTRLRQAPPQRRRHPRL